MLLERICILYLLLWILMEEKMATGKFSNRIFVPMLIFPSTHFRIVSLWLLDLFLI